MPLLDPQYLYPNGAISASGHAGNLASSTAEYGLYTLYNGSLDSNNLALANFTTTEMQLSEFAAFDRHSWAGPWTVYDDTIGGPDDATGSPCGLGLRFFLPSEMDTVRLDFSTFISNARAVRLNRSDVTTAFTGAQTSLEMKIVPFFDGAPLTDKTFKLPQNFYLGITASPPVTAGAANHATILEHRYAQQYRNSYVLTNVAKGAHSFELRVIIESPGARFTFEAANDKVGLNIGDFAKDEGFGAVGHQRLTFGCGCITMRAIGLNQP